MQLDTSPGAPAWSPDGRSIAFGVEVRPDLLNAQRADLFVKQLGQDGFHRLTNDGKSFQPAW